MYNVKGSTDVGGQHCPCPVLISFLSGFSGKSCPVSVCCPDFLSSVCLSGFCLPGFYLSRFSPPTRFCPDFRKKLSVVCLSGRTRTRSGISLFLSADVWFSWRYFRHRRALSVSSPCLVLSWFSEKSCPISVCCLDYVQVFCPKSVW